MTTPSRIGALLSLLSLIGCAPSRAAAPDLPKSVSPGWTLTKASKSGEMWDAEYGGPGNAVVRIWPVRGASEGLDRVQKWRAAPNTVVFYSDHYFASVAWQGGNRAQTGALVQALERALR